MRRLFFVCLSAVLLAGSVATQRSIAQDLATVLDHYRLLPRLSTLHQTGGIAGFDLRYRLLGDYSFAHGTASTASAKFVNAEIWGSLISDGPTPAYVIDVDEILNLEGLQGKALPVAAPYDVYQFQGNTSDGSSVNLFASILGPWMYLRGATQPPPGSADYFEYQLRALARSGPFADMNSDGIVDASDYALLRKSGFAGGGDVMAGVGFAEWRQQYGETVPDLKAMDAVIEAALGSGVAVSSVPEPASSLLLLTGLSVVCATSARARRAYLAAM